MDVCNLLNELIAMHARSLPVYLTDAIPWLTEKEAATSDVLNIIAADHLMTVDRLAEAVLDRDGTLRMGTFPTYFTGLHDLSIDYLLGETTKRQAADTKRIAEIAAALAPDAQAAALAKECWGAAQGHLESLRELQAAVSPTA